jgi:hypothetical protein
MTTQQSYEETMKQDFAALIDGVEVPELAKRFLRLRWLDQMLWAEGRAVQARDRYYTLRLVAIIGGVVVPALVSLQLQADAAKIIGWFAFTISLVVAVCLAIESFFRWGERWLHYRRMAELLKSEGWLFFQLAGAYSGSHAGAYPEFAKRVESILASDVEAYVAQMAPDKSKQNDGKS